MIVVVCILSQSIRAEEASLQDALDFVEKELPKLKLKRNQSDSSDKEYEVYKYSFKQDGSCRVTVVVNVIEKFDVWRTDREEKDDYFNRTTKYTFHLNDIEEMDSFYHYGDITLMFQAEDKDIEKEYSSVSKGPKRRKKERHNWDNYFSLDFHGTEENKELSDRILAALNHAKNKCSSRKSYF